MASVPRGGRIGGVETHRRGPNSPAAERPTALLPPVTEKALRIVCVRSPYRYTLVNLLFRQNQVKAGRTVP